MKMRGLVSKKRIFDFSIALFLILGLAPIYLLIAALVKLDSSGPVLFVQERIGINGIPFNMFKFRTMIENAEFQGTGLFSYKNDPRITRIGRWLRVSSFDEFPQLLNVLIGDMSIVGPRPPVTYELGDYADFTPIMRIRFEVKPGITGLAQVSGRNDLSWEEKIVFDNIYVSNFKKNGLSVDFKILLKTIFTVFSRKGVIEKKRENCE